VREVRVAVVQPLGQPKVNVFGGERDRDLGRIELKGRRAPSRAATGAFVPLTSPRPPALVRYQDTPLKSTPEQRREIFARLRREWGAG
jgi:hypothetical protein